MFCMTSCAALSLLACADPARTDDRWATGVGGEATSGGKSGTGAADGSGAADGAAGSMSTGGEVGMGGEGGTGGSVSTGGAATGGGEATGGAAAGGTDTGGTSGGTGGAGSGGGLPDLPKFVGNITTGYDHSVDTSGKSFKNHWDQITPENAGKWGSVQSSFSAAPYWGALDAIYDYAEENGIIFKQHAFVWGSQQPNGNATEADVKTWIQTFCQRYPNTKLIDVVNEPPPHTTPSYAEAIGGGSFEDWAWITNSFKWAREYCPNSILILNDYNNIEWDGDSLAFIDIVNVIQANGAPVDAIGAQAHDLDHSGVTTNKMKALVAQLHGYTNLPVYITEYDISTPDDAKQLQLYQEHFQFFLETEYIKGVTLWGWIVGQTWSLAPDSGLIRADGTARPAMTWLMDELSRPQP
jgi:endo-1,4-beta-xylanase